MKCRPALEAMSSKRIVPDVSDVCTEAFDRTEDGVNATAETRLRVRIRVKKRMLNESAEWFVPTIVPQSGASKMIYRHGATPRGFPGSVMQFRSGNLPAFSQNAIRNYDRDPWRIRAENASMPNGMLNLARNQINLLGSLLFEDEIVTSN